MFDKSHRLPRHNGAIFIFIVTLLFLALNAGSANAMDKPALYSARVDFDADSFEARIQSPTSIIFENEEMSIAIEIDVENQEVEITTESPDGISIIRRKIPNDRASNENVFEIFNTLQQNNVRVDGRLITLDQLIELSQVSTPSLLDRIAFVSPRSVGSGALQLIGIETAYAINCEGLCDTESQGFLWSAASVIAACGSVPYGGPLAWIACATTLGMLNTAASSLATCIQNLPPACKFEEQQ